MSRFKELDESRRNSLARSRPAMLRQILEFITRRKEGEISVPLDAIVEIQRRIDRAYKRGGDLGLAAKHPIMMDLQIASIILKKSCGRPR
jgi:hypothetical protein